MSQPAQNRIGNSSQNIFSSQSYFLIGQGQSLVAAQALAAPRFAAARFPLKDQNSPRHADALVIAGPVNRRYKEVVARLAAQLAWPYNIIPIGSSTPEVEGGATGNSVPPDHPEKTSSSFEKVFLSPKEASDLAPEPLQIAAILHTAFAALPVTGPSQGGAARGAGAGAGKTATAAGREAETGPGTLVPLRTTEEKELATEDLTLSLGPAHPALYGPLRLVLTLDGEQVAVAEADPGYAHRGLEKLAEGKQPLAALALGAALDALAPLAGTMATTLALENMLFGEVDVKGETGPQRHKETETLPRRAGFLRLIALELERIASHLFAQARILKTVALDGKAGKVLELYAEVAGVIRQVCGNSPYLYILPGGVQTDLNSSSINLLAGLVRQLRVWVRQEAGPPAHSFFKSILDYTLKSRLEGLGWLGLTEAVELGFTGPNLRASGHSLDWRSAHSFAQTGLPYQDLAFSPALAFSRTQEGARNRDRWGSGGGDIVGGDAYQRYWQRTGEIATSTGLIDLALRTLPSGPVRLDVELDQALMERLLNIKAETSAPWEAGGIVESPRGILEARLALTLDAQGKIIIERLRFRSPSWPHFQAAGGLITGARLPDALVIINSLDIAPDEAER